MTDEEPQSLRRAWSTYDELRFIKYLYSRADPELLCGYWMGLQQRVIWNDLNAVEVRQAARQALTRP